jgi:hypothetical protein
VYARLPLSISDDIDAATDALIHPGSVYACVSVIIAVSVWKFAIIGVAATAPFAATAYVYHVRRNGLYEHDWFPIGAPIGTSVVVFSASCVRHGYVEFVT